MFKFKKLAAVVLAVVMVSAMSTSVFAASPSDNFSGKGATITISSPRSGSSAITENYVRLRSGPGLSYPAIRQLQKGDYVTFQYEDRVNADGYTWVSVQTSEGIYGWVAEIYLQDPQG